LTRQTEQRRAALRDRLIEIAEREIASHGTGALRARALAKEADCALGAIYNVFDDMTGLTLAVNMRTFERIGRYISGAMAGHLDKAPYERLIVMSNAYVDFAEENLNLWRALFDVEMTAESAVPGWYLDELGRMFRHISGPLAEADPAADAAEIERRTRTLFSAVHGIMLLSLEHRISGVPRDDLKPMIAFLLSRVLR
jgi:AcrR family transcriptional regulator